ncbi:MAG: NUDIX hydrolase [Candidatus Sumerlaeaceae bacterium]|nr:NUDIX hydrolase [Candidatus Sumerlaeaceae bacterium]
MTEPRWLAWVKELHALAQTGLHYASNEYDRDRYTAVLRIAAEMAAAQSGAPAEKILDLFRVDTGYITPKVDVRVVVMQDWRILLVQELADGGRWTLPGGWADVNASPAENCVREVREESGFEVRPVRLLALYDRSLRGHEPPMPVHVYKIYFQCEMTGGEARSSAETGRVEFFAEEEIPVDLSLSRVTREQIHRMFELVRRPDLPPDFD